MQLYSLLLLIWFSLFEYTNAALYHQCVPFSINPISDRNGSINIDVGVSTSLLIYNLADTSLTNIPLELDDEYIKEYVNQFSVCGLQDLATGYCQYDQFGQFTVRRISDEQPKHGMVNEMITDGSVRFDVPYTGVWCYLLYQDGSYFQRYNVSSVQQFGYLSIVEYNKLTVSQLLSFIEFFIVIWGWNQYNKQIKIGKFITSKEKSTSEQLLKLISIELLSNILTVFQLNSKNQNSNELFQLLTVILVGILKVYFYLIIFHIASGYLLKPSKESTSQLPKSESIFLHSIQLYTTLIIIKEISISLSKLITNSTILQINDAIHFTVQIFIWLILYKVSLKTLDKISNNEELNAFKITRVITVSVPIIFTIFSQIFKSIYESFINNSTDLITDPLIKKILVIPLTKNFIYSILSNLNLFGPGLIISLLFITWGKKSSNSYV